ncbi:MAG: ABC transporter ATP-binding protein [Candidatus Poseidoniaceae archaeon]|nr:hypothetical protein [Euryarchaeota archaeon]RAH05343.1 MAG: hypothetical protein CBC92_005935 [Euryarchaeota archaeon TMED132]|tara:strand:- start:2660 stop:3313 length:654 start_codon:yes stop_codon:yes gene_type:complete
MSEEMISITNLSKKFKDLNLFNGLNLSVNKDEIIAIIGPSGCGKTTILRMICGLEKDYSGTIKFEGEDISEISVQDKIGFIFQKPILFPHLNVGRNILLGCKEKGDKKFYNQIIERELEFIGLPGFEKRKVESLSGGESQRVALARALLAKPQLLLLDEPFSALDVKSRRNLAKETRKFLKSRKMTAIHVTHDKEEAELVADIIFNWDSLCSEIKTD